MNEMLLLCINNYKHGDGPKHTHVDKGWKYECTKCP
jgi:hypothetical protein